MSDSRGTPVDPAVEQRALLMQAATLHLDRVTTLSNRNWNADILYWGVILASGSTLIGYSVKTDSLLSGVIANQSWLIIGGYYLSMMIYFFLMESNKHRSLVTERNRYQLAQDAALRSAGISSGFEIHPGITASGSKLRFRAFRILHRPAHVVMMTARRGAGGQPSYRPIRRRRIFSSAVWGAKLMSTLTMVSAIFVISQVAADYAETRRRFDALKEMEIARLAPVPAFGRNTAWAERARLAIEQSLAVAKARPFESDRGSPLCALIACGEDPADPVYRRHDPGAPFRLEAGTWIWLVGGLAFGLFGLIAFRRGSV